MNEDPYKRVANLYDRLFEPMNRGLNLLGLRMSSPKKDMKVLDVGCGTGALLEQYSKYGCQLYGIDPSPSMFDIARSRLGVDAHLTLGSAQDMPYEDGFFDQVLCMLVLHEMEPEMRILALDEMERVLHQDGSILLIDFHVGPSRPLKGWLTRAFIFLSELLAGRRHFRLKSAHKPS